MVIVLFFQSDDCTTLCYPLQDISFQMINIHTPQRLTFVYRSILTGVSYLLNLMNVFFFTSSPTIPVKPIRGFFKSLLQNYYTDLANIHRGNNCRTSCMFIHVKRSFCLVNIYQPSNVCMVGILSSTCSASTGAHWCLCLWLLWTQPECYGSKYNIVNIFST